MKTALNKKPNLEIIFLFLISAIAYLPNIGSLSYFKDDWYYIYDGLIAGKKIFHFMFSIDRPARGYFFEWYFSLFGVNPLPWHLSAFLWRVLSIVGALWIFNIIWKKERKFTFLAALLFGIYPGYFWWISAIEYQPMIASLALQTFSIAFTLKALESQNKILRVIFLTGALLTGWACIALVDYAIGMEVFRFLVVFVFLNRGSQKTFFAKVSASIRAFGWNVLIPVGFVFWRIFLFKNQRQATDIGFQLSGLLENPLAVTLHWFLQLYNSLLNLAVLAWVNQFPRYIFGLRLRDITIGLVIAGITALLLWLANKFLQEDNADGDESVLAVKEAISIGGIGMIFGILPIIMANRFINLDSFSHYALPASLAAALFFCGVIYSWSVSEVRISMTYAVVIFASLAHYGISMNAVNEENAIQKFWWQVNWRVPALKADTLLVIQYPSPNIGDDGNGVVEAANVMYFAQPSQQIPVQYPLAALTLNDSNLQDLMIGSSSKENIYRSHSVTINYGNILVMSQPTPTSCVHVLDGRRPLISQYDTANVLLIAPSSKIENVIADAMPAIPQEFSFGSEPERGWCYYYEKAELALQLGKIMDVVEFGEDAIRLGLTPEDRSEWLPFLYAYALTGDEIRVKQISTKINSVKSLRLQACTLLTEIDKSVEPEIRELTAALYCKGK